MRVLYFSHGYTTHDKRFLSKMAASRHEISFLRLDDDGEAQAPILPERVRGVRWRGAVAPPTPETCLRAMPRFKRAVTDIRPDVIHAGPIPTCAFMVALSGFRPLVSMSWGSDILLDAQQDDFLAWTAQYALESTDMFVVDCDAVRERISALIGAADERFIQFPWGLELSRFPRPRPRRSTSDRVTVLSTRSWAPIYGIDTLIEAFDLAHLEDDRLRLVLVGDGPLAPEVNRAIEARGLEAIVTRPGRVPETSLREYFLQADMYVSCALSDGTSVSLLEAMAHGLPVIATDVPGNREWVDAGRGGWLAQPKDARSFADAMLGAAHLHDDARHAIAEYNRTLVEKRADWDSNFDRLLAAYERIDSAKTSVTMSPTVTRPQQDLHAVEIARSAIPAAIPSKRRIEPTERFEGQLASLRLVTLTDCTERYVSWLQDPEVNRYLETRWSPQTLESIRSFVSSKSDSLDSYLFAIVDRATASHVGNLKIGPIHSRYGYADLSYFIGERASWGRGLATDAIRIASSVAFERLELHRMQAGLYASNVGSARALEKAGYHLEGRFAKHVRGDVAWEDYVWYGLLRDRWEAMPRT